jgi:Zn-dependent M28 family amino/carboxypeptidase
MRPLSILSRVAALVVWISVARAQQVEPQDAVERAARRIVPSRIMGSIRYLSSDLLEGRGPGSRGDLLAREYLASQLEMMGYEPGAPNGHWEQRFEAVGLTTEVPAMWSFANGGRRESLKVIEDFTAQSGVQREQVAFENAEVVFVGYGIQAPEYDWDDFKGADLKGKVLLMLNNDPDWDPELFDGNRRLYYGRWDYKFQSAARQGAAAAVIIHTTPSAGYPWQVVQTSFVGEQFELPAGNEPRLLATCWATEAAAKRLATLGRRDLDELIESAHSRQFKPVPLGIHTSLGLRASLRRIEAANVLGLLPGSDPDLKKEVVVYSAHYDHLGVVSPDSTGDRIANGAMDNASGCGQVLAIAHALTVPGVRVKRSILVAFVGLEEQGLLGSEYYAEHPTFHPGRIAANINYDSANVWGRTHDITYVGYGKSSLDEIVDREAGRQGRVVKGDQFPDRGLFYRSDQFNFSKIGVPAIYFKAGTQFEGRDYGFGRRVIEEYEASRYHQPADEVLDTWELAGAAQDAELGFRCGIAIANQDAMPDWRPGDEFSAARNKAIAELALP